LAGVGPSPTMTAEAGCRPPEGLVWGRQDRVTPLAAAREAASDMVGPLDVIDDAGHFLGVDQPEVFLGSLRRALDGG
jgi:pimeloyl-ACP methyl ester carboxylesterase